jgi:hypothetical protein
MSSTEEKKKKKSVDINAIRNRIKAIEADLYEKGAEHINTVELYKDVAARLELLPIEFDILLIERKTLCELIGWEGDMAKMRQRVAESLQVEPISDNIS